jgi:hypothetical protein
VSNQSRDNTEGVISLLAGIGVGVLLGGAIALLLAPQAGEQTRAQIKESADDALGRLRHSMEELREKVDEVAHAARDAMNQRRPGSEPPALSGDIAGATDESAPPAL